MNLFCLYLSLYTRKWYSTSPKFFALPYCIFTPKFYSVPLSFSPTFIQNSSLMLLPPLYPFFKICLPLPYLKLLLPTGQSLVMTMGSQVRIVASKAMLPWRCSLRWRARKIDWLAPRCAAVQTAQTGLCSAGCPSARSSTIQVVTSLPFVRRSLWRR